MVNDYCQIDIGSHCGQRVVVLHPYSDLLVYRQPGRLPHGRAHGDAHQLTRGPGIADGSTVRHPLPRLHLGLLQGKLYHEVRWEMLHSIPFHFIPLYVLVQAICLYQVFTRTPTLGTMRIFLANIKIVVERHERWI